MKTVRELVDSCRCHIYIPNARDVLWVVHARVYLDLPKYRLRCQSHHQAERFHDPQNRNRQGYRNGKAVSLMRTKKRGDLGPMPN